MSPSYTPKAGVIPIVVVKPHGEHLLAAAQKVKTETVVEESLSHAAATCARAQGAVVLLHLTQPTEVTPYLGFLKEVRPALAQNRLRILLVLGFPENEVLQKMAEYGFSETVRDPIPEKSLLFKLEKTHRQLLQLTHQLGLPAGENGAAPTNSPPVLESVSAAQTVQNVANASFDPKLSAISIGFLVSELMSSPQVLDRNASGVKTGVQFIAQRACDFLRESCENKSRFEVWLWRANEWKCVTESAFSGKNAQPELPSGYPAVETQLKLAAHPALSIPPEGIDSKAALVYESNCPLGQDYLRHSLDFLRGVLLEELLEA